MTTKSKRARNGGPSPSKSPSKTPSKTPSKAKEPAPARRRSLPILASGNGASPRGGNRHGNGSGNGHADGHANGNGAKQGSPVSCTSCGLCCTYIVLDIDAPTTLDGASTALWYLYHPGLSLYTADGDWMVQFDTRCKFLEPDNRCGIYESRPQICREFDERECEVNAEDVGISFYEPQAFLDWLAQHHKRIHTLLAKRYLPSAAKLAAGPADRRVLTPFDGRVRAMRALSHPS